MSKNEKRALGPVPVDMKVQLAAASGGLPPEAMHSVHLRFFIHANGDIMHFESIDEIGSDGSERWFLKRISRPSWRTDFRVKPDACLTADWYRRLPADQWCEVV